MDFEGDVASMAEEWARRPGHADLLPIMNFRPGVPRQVSHNYHFAPYAPRLFACNQLLPYFLLIHCTCGRVTEVSGKTAAKLIVKADRAPIQHLLDILVCGTCQGRPAKIEIERHADRGLHRAPRQIVTRDAAAE